MFMQMKDEARRRSGSTSTLQGGHRGKGDRSPRSVEETKAHGIRSKPPKSKAGRRDLTLPDILVDALREFWKEQLQLRLKLGAGKLPDDGLLFADLEGAAHSPSAVSRAFSDFTARIRMAGATYVTLTLAN
jgi:hypothetical protein